MKILLGFMLGLLVGLGIGLAVHRFGVMEHGCELTRIDSLTGNVWVLTKHGWYLMPEGLPMQPPQSTP